MDEKKEKLETTLSAEAILEAMPDALNVLDLDGRIVAVNPAYTKMFGWKPEEIIGKTVEDMSKTFVKPEDLEFILKTMGEAIETDVAGKPVETVVLTKDGREVPISVTYSLVKDAEGNLKEHRYHNQGHHRAQAHSG